MVLPIRLLLKSPTLTFGAESLQLLLLKRLWVQNLNLQKKVGVWNVLFDTLAPLNPWQDDGKVLTSIDVTKKHVAVALAALRWNHFGVAKKKVVWVETKTQWPKHTRTLRVDQLYFINTHRYILHILYIPSPLKLAYLEAKYASLMAQAPLNLSISVPLCFAKCWNKTKPNPQIFVRDPKNGLTRSNFWQNVALQFLDVSRARGSLRMISGANRGSHITRSRICTSPRKRWTSPSISVETSCAECPNEGYR